MRWRIHPLLRLLWIAAVLGANPAMSSPEKALDGSWAAAEVIAARVQAPRFGDHAINIQSTGAVADGQTNALPAIRKAIEALASAGGGRVLVPDGTFYVEGAVHLDNGVELHLQRGATLRFSGDPKHYLPVVLTRWEGTIVFNYSPLIYARDKERVGVTGEGKIECSGGVEFASWSAKQAEDQSELRLMGAKDVAVPTRVFGEGHWLRPSAIQFFGCTDVLVEGVTVKDAPFWVIHPAFCRNVTIRRVRVHSHNPNNDACVIDSSVDVLIEDCDIDTAEDAVALKSGRDRDARLVARPTENVVVRNVRVSRARSGLSIGSEMSGGVRHVYAEGLRIDLARIGVNFKSNLDRGGVVEGIWIRDIRIDTAAENAVRLETAYEGYRGGSFPPVFRNVVIEKVHCGRAGGEGVYIDGLDASPIANVRLLDVTVEKAARAALFRHTKELQLREVRVNGTAVEAD
jgi:polygalacturonase